MKKILLILLLLFCLFANAQTPFTYNADTLMRKDGKVEYRFYGLHRYYKDGDLFKIINNSMLFDKTLKVYTQNKASYSSEFPEYADGWFSFLSSYKGADIIIRSRPIADHVLGVLSDNLKTVLYKDAFGTGINFLATAAKTGVVKEIIITKKPEKLVDLEFCFELDLPVGAIIKDAYGNVKTGDIEFKGQMLSINKGDKNVYFTKALLWDGESNEYDVDIKIRKSNGKITLVKCIPKEFLDVAVYPIRTDHPTDYTGNAADGFVTHSTSSSWSTCRNAADGTAVSKARSDQEWVRTEYVSSTTYYCSRLFYAFDTSAIPDGDTVTNAVLNLYTEYKYNGDNDGYDYSVVVESTQASSTDLTTADYDACGSTKGSDQKDTDDIAADSWEPYTLNATGLSWISKTGYTKLCLRHGHDLDNVTPEGRATHEFAPYESAYDPYLSVTTTSPATAGQVIFFSR